MNILQPQSVDIYRLLKAS